jgi:hypothetical protein
MEILSNMEAVVRKLLDNLDVDMEGKVCLLPASILSARLKAHGNT